jgi:UDP-N-acetylglucosamine--N-acetylmuramyl-(pentapeptide) pyrophosphoryl-undecaprenol N-acetylglucosamine transferase
MPIPSIRERCTDVSSLRIIFAGGGTGGHLFPALAIADEIKRINPDAEILFVGTKDKIESRIIPKTGYGFRTIWISGFHRGFRMSNILFPLKMIVSFLQSYFIMRSFKPQAVVGTGGYVSGPVLRAAILKGLPTLIHEQNSYPGITTRILAPKVSEIHLTFEKSKKFLKGSVKTFISGNPTRSSLENADRNEALKYFGFSNTDKLKTVLLFGGSLGAHSLNLAMISSIAALMQKEIRLIWQTGLADYEHVREITGQFPADRIWVNAFIERMDYAYTISDLVVCRAGATTIAELTRLGKPSVLVPYPHAAANHQVENAQALSEAGVAVIVYDHEIRQKLFSTITDLIGGEHLAQMSEKSRLLGKSDAAAVLANHVIQLAQSYGRV